jgi:hypothetical protein
LFAALAKSLPGAIDIFGNLGAKRVKKTGKTLQKQRQCYRIFFLPRSPVRSVLEPQTI